MTVILATMMSTGVTSEVSLLNPLTKHTTVESNLTMRPGAGMKGNSKEAYH